MIHCFFKALKYIGDKTPQSFIFLAALQFSVTLNCCFNSCFDKEGTEVMCVLSRGCPADEKKLTLGEVSVTQAYSALL